MPKFFVENSSGLYHRTLHRNVTIVAHHVTVALLSSAFNKFITLDITWHIFVCLWISNV